MVTKKIRQKKQDGTIIEADIGANAANVTQDANYRFVSDTEKAAWNAKLSSTGDGTNLTANFTEATSFANIVSGEKMSITLGKIKKAISSLISHSALAASTTMAGHVKYGTTAGTACQGNDSRLSDARIPTVHTSINGTTYGMGTGTVFGHVKLADKYGSSAASNGVAVTPKALNDCYIELASDIDRLDGAKAAISHASESNVNGSGTDKKYGHVKLSDTYVRVVSGGAAADGMAASQKSVADAYSELNSNLTGNKYTVEVTNYSLINLTAQSLVVKSNRVLLTLTGTCLFESAASNHVTSMSLPASIAPPADIGCSIRAWYTNGVSIVPAAMFVKTDGTIGLQTSEVHNIVFNVSCSWDI